jgi:hypothetical protein
VWPSLAPRGTLTLALAHSAAGLRVPVGLGVGRASGGGAHVDGLRGAFGAIRLSSRSPVPHVPPSISASVRARWVTLRARWVTLRARWVTLRARWVTLRARWVTLRARLGELRARWVTLRALHRAWHRIRSPSHLEALQLAGRDAAFAVARQRGHAAPLGHHPAGLVLLHQLRQRHRRHEAAVLQPVRLPAAAAAQPLPHRLLRHAQVAGGVPQRLGVLRVSGAGVWSQLTLLALSISSTSNRAELAAWSPGEGFKAFRICAYGDVSNVRVAHTPSGTAGPTRPTG